MKTLWITLLIVVSINSLKLQRNHDLWYTSGRAYLLQNINVPERDKNWDYCDMKCTAFEKSVPNVDFFLINFRTSRTSPIAAMCYGKSATGDIQLWSNYIQNDFFQQHCGHDNIDYRKSGALQVGTEGAGIGNDIKY